MLVVGLTGSIGMGKSTTAGLFREAGIPVHDADAAVHALYSGEAASLIEARFPGTTDNGAVNRDKLSKAVLGNSQAFKALEMLVHPLVLAKEKIFLEEARRNGTTLVVLDIPLLFETGAKDRVDLVLVVTAPVTVQKARVMARSGMTEEKFAAIVARQVPDIEKRRQADMIIDTSRGLDAAWADVQEFIRKAPDLASAKGTTP